MKFYMAAIISHFTGFMCTASLLSEYWALTAAHCRLEPSDYLRVGGATVFAGRTYNIERTFRHPEYTKSASGTEASDIQLIKLSNPVPSDSKFFHVNVDANYPAPHSFVRACGYGDTYGTASPSTGLLREVDVPVQTTGSCSKQLSDVSISVDGDVHLCAGYDNGGCDSCYGDSGGPLFAYGKDLIPVQVGIVSYGVECALAMRPGVYTRLSTFVPWMRKVGAVFKTSSDAINVYGPSHSPFSPNPPGPSQISATPTATAVHTPEAPGPTSDTSQKPSQTAQQSSAEQHSEPQESGAQESKPNSASTAMPTDVPTPQSSSGEPACFPGAATVTLEDGTTKSMNEIMIGDRVKVGSQEYSEVFMFTHRIHKGVFNFISIECTACQTPLRLSHDHILPVNGRFRPAREVRVGDSVVMSSGIVSTVSKIAQVSESGLFNPQTLDGRIIVNDVLVSTYTAAIEQNAAHALLAPLRYLFRTLKMGISFPNEQIISAQMRSCL